MLCLSRFFSRLARFSSFIFFFSFASLGGRLQSADIDEKEIRKEKPEELVVALAHAKVILALFCSRTGFRCYIFFCGWYSGLKRESIYPHFREGEPFRG